VPNGMLEDVARAIAEAISKGKDPARAAIAAMRTPTREMIAAGVLSMRHVSRDHMHDDANLEAAYRGMIDKALGHASREQNLSDPQTEATYYSR
jgi:hypothetical protein